MQYYQIIVSLSIFCIFLDIFIGFLVMLNGIFDLVLLLLSF